MSASAAKNKAERDGDARERTSRIQEGFTSFLLQSGALKFGDFTLKSGRRSPYFINAGAFNDGRLIALLGEFYARTIVQAVKRGTLPADIDTVFGPAYKGIPLAVGCGVHHGRVPLPGHQHRQRPPDLRCCRLHEGPGRVAHSGPAHSRCRQRLFGALRGLNKGPTHISAYRLCMQATLAHNLRTAILSADPRVDW